jgi:enoyl-CoA hydratase
MIETRMEEGVAVLTLAHGKANILDLDFCRAIVARLTELRESEARAIVLTGRGNIFCAGVDLKQVSEGGAAYLREFLPALHDLYEAAFFHPKPIVAAINGHAVAGGAVLAACADRRIMARDSGRIGITELLVGVPFPVLAFEVVRFALPPRYLAESMLSGATYPTEAALQRGWVDELAEPSALMDSALAAARHYAALSPPAFAQTKKQIRQEVAAHVARDRAADQEVTDIWCAPETLARIRDYVARTLKK